MSLKIVTDSTCDVPAELVERYNLTVVPAYVNIGPESYLDGVNLARSEFYDKLASYPSYPTTAAPAPAQFAAVYEQLAAEGASAILSLHIASSLSSFCNSAIQGAQTAALTTGVPITVWDSRQLSMGLGFQVLAAAEAAEAGATLAEITALLADLRPRIHIFCLLETLDAVRRGGRINWLQMSMGNLLKIKPLVHAYEGEVNLVERVRTRGRALPRLVEMVRELGPLSHLALLDANSAEEAHKLGELLRPHLPPDLSPLYNTACPAIGVHVGAQALAVGCVVQGS
jgi:DegV family protein with EDD domain